jgi:cytoskeletal protein RodZ
MTIGKDVIRGREKKKKKQFFLVRLLSIFNVQHFLINLWILCKHFLIR